MRQVRNRYRRQVTGATMLLGALTVLGVAWTLNAPRFIGAAGARDLLLAGSLLIAIVVAYEFPIYIRHNVKLCIISVPLFLLAALLPPAVAGLVGLLAMLAGETVVGRKRGTLLGDRLTGATRWSVLLVAASVIAHVQMPHSDQIVSDLPLVTAAVFLWFGDLITLPILLCPICNERPGRVIATAGREGGLAEAAQYFIGLIGVLLASHQIWGLALLLVPAAMVYLAFRKEVDPDTFQLLESMVDNIDRRDPYLGDHSRRVAELVKGMLAELGMHGQEARQIVTAARLHDLGKLDLPEGILLKAGSLTPDEQALLESYPGRGAELLSGYPDFSRGLDMVRHHHERWDGTGYPTRLSGTTIPFGARVIAVADSFDAMTHERSYRQALAADQAAEILCQGRGRQWDAQLVEVLLTSVADRLSGPVSFGPALPEMEVAPHAERVPA